VKVKKLAVQTRSNAKLWNIILLHAATHNVMGHIHELVRFRTERSKVTVWVLVWGFLCPIRILSKQQAWFITRSQQNNISISIFYRGKLMLKINCTRGCEIRVRRMALCCCWTYRYVWLHCIVCCTCQSSAMCITPVQSSSDDSSVFFEQNESLVTVVLQTLYIKRCIDRQVTRDPAVCPTAPCAISTSQLASC